ncbi:UNVERIFIED_CONTAM: hypothetical protein HDU68_012828 [Siphonaria sp. JEL0065]|nr:hypothetical protein HDU68_012828 [Siphonaria sp. JEL0065]
MVIWLKINKIMGTSALIRFIKIQNGEGKNYGGYRSHYDGYPNGRGVELATVLKDLCMFNNGYNTQGPYKSAHGMEDLVMQVGYHLKRFTIPGEGFAPPKRRLGASKERCTDNPLMGNLSFVPAEDMDDYLYSSIWVYTVRWYVDLSDSKAPSQHIEIPTQKQRYDMNNHGTITVSVTSGGDEPIEDMDFEGPVFGIVDSQVAARIATLSAVAERVERERIESYNKECDAEQEFRLEQKFKLKLLSPEQQEVFANDPKRIYYQANNDYANGKITKDEHDVFRTKYFAAKQVQEAVKGDPSSNLIQCQVIRKTMTTTTTNSDGTKTTSTVTTSTAVPQLKPSLEEWVATYVKQQEEETKVWRKAYSANNKVFLEKNKAELKAAKEEYRVYYDELMMNGAEMTTQEFWEHCWAFTEASRRGES